MKSKKRSFIFLIVLIVFAISACNLPFLGGEKSETQEPEALPGTF
jgi:flagellar basal body-associated protein FliL